MSNKGNENKKSSQNTTSSSDDPNKKKEKELKPLSSNSKDKKHEKPKSKASDNDDNDNDTETKSPKKQKAAKQKSHQDDDSEKSQTDSDSDASDGDDENFGPDYNCTCQENESDNSDNSENDEGQYSDDDDDDNDDDNDYHPRDIQSRDVGQNNRPHRRPRKTKSYSHHQYPNSQSKQTNFSGQQSQPTSRSTKCDSDIRTDPTTQKGRKKIAKKTLEITKYGPNMGKYTIRHRNGSIEYVNIRHQISNAFKHTETFDPNFKITKLTKQPRPTMCKIEVLPSSTYGAAKNLVKQDHLRTCVLNYASATKPGGGFLNGRQAQEESLARQSALYVTIKNSQMYKANSKSTDDLYNDYMIYSSRVPVFRSSYRERLLSGREVFEVSVITSAAPNLQNINKDNGPIMKAFKLWWKGYKGKVTDRCRKILCLAIEKGNEAIVLGAYGCGVFENSPDKISKIFKKLLIDEGLGKYFVKVVFAILDRNSDNFKAFDKTFKS